MRKIDYIVIHHSLTNDGATVSWAAIEKHHRETQGWRDIGYHAGVELVADPTGPLGAYAYQGLVGRPPSAVAAACPQAGMNERGLHLCLIGDFDVAAPPLKQLMCAVRRFLLPWMSQYGIPAERIIGHRDAGLMDGFDWRKVDAEGRRQYKTCPGLHCDLDLVRSMVR